MDRSLISDRATVTLPVVTSASLRPNAVLTWTQIGSRAPQLASTMTNYLAQIAISSRPGTVESAGLSLRVFAEHLIESDPGCRCVADISRTHIESFKLALAKRPGKNSDRPATATIRHKLGMVRTFFERIIEWDYEDSPRKVPIFAGDFPKADEPLPRFLDDPTAAKLMAGLAKEPILRKRLAVEFLARTGMRSGELGALRDDGVFRLSGHHWLKIPVGKLHNDRTVPLHPVLVDLITEYRAERGASPSGHLMVRVDGRPIDRRTVHRYVETIARRAGVGHVHPHQLRHTLATQLINRGVSLEAIAALLGHRSPAHDARLRPHLERQRGRAVLPGHPGGRAVRRCPTLRTRKPSRSLGHAVSSATGTAPGRPSSTAPSRPSARGAASSIPAPSSSRSSAGRRTTRRSWPTSREHGSTKS